MNGRTIVLLIAVALIGFGLTGCKKKEEPAAPTTTSIEGMAKQATTAAEDVKEEATAAAEGAKETAETMAASMEQTMCPIMDGNKIDKNVFVEYKGKKVYFCCEACKATFEKEPEKYIAKLPQFSQ